MFLNCSEQLLGEVKSTQDSHMLAKKSKALAPDHVTSKTKSIKSKDDTESDNNSRSKLVMDEKKALGNPGWPTKADNSLAQNQMKPVPPSAQPSSSKF